MHLDITTKKISFSRTNKFYIFTVNQFLYLPMNVFLVLKPHNNGLLSRTLRDCTKSKKRNLQQLRKGSFYILLVKVGLIRSQQFRLDFLIFCQASPKNVLCINYQPISKTIEIKKKIFIFGNYVTMYFLNPYLDTRKQSVVFTLFTCEVGVFLDMSWGRGSSRVFCLVFVNPCKQ